MQKPDAQSVFELQAVPSGFRGTLTLTSMGGAGVRDRVSGVGFRIGMIAGGVVGTAREDDQGQDESDERG